MVKIEAPAECEEPLDRWRADAHAFSESRVRAYTDRKINELQTMLEARMDAGIATEVTTTREFVLEVVGQALGEFRQMIIDEMSETYRDTFAKLSTSVDELRAQVAKLNGKQPAEPIDLPNPIAARRLQ